MLVNFHIFLRSELNIFDSGSNIYPPHANPKNIFLPTQNIIFYMNNKILKHFRFVLVDTSLSSTKSKLALIFFRH